MNNCFNFLKFFKLIHLICRGSFCLWFDFAVKEKPPLPFQSEENVRKYTNVYTTVNTAVYSRRQHFTYGFDIRVLHTEGDIYRTNKVR